MKIKIKTMKSARMKSDKIKSDTMKFEEMTSTIANVITFQSEGHPAWKRWSLCRPERIITESSIPREVRRVTLR